MPDALQGVTKDRIRAVLQYLHLGSNADLVDCTFALLDDQTASWFSKAPDGTTIADGASTAHLACHIGILQRDSGKLDRKGRDYWIKPLRELGGFEAITLENGEFIPGHVKAKSPNSCYRLDEALKAVLKAPQDAWRDMLAEWARDDVSRERRAFQAEMAEAARKLIDSGHAHLIKASVENYAPRFLLGYQLLYVDDADGDRISDAERAKMAEAGVALTRCLPQRQAEQDLQGKANLDRALREGLRMGRSRDGHACRPSWRASSRCLTPFPGAIDGAKLLMRRQRRYGCHAGCP